MRAEVNEVEMNSGISQLPRPQVLSIPERIDADLDAAGRGIVMAFVDSGFYPHPDLMRPQKRILGYVDAVRADANTDDFLTARPSAWHGTMTACAAAGNGYLSGGRYRGLASDARVVLIKCADENGGIRGKNVASAIRFAVRHPELRVSVMNVSVGVSAGDPDVNDVLLAVKEAVLAGIAVFCAAGNTEGALPEPPASAPEAITVGGWNDGNTRDPSDDRWFPSSYGHGKPDLLAPAIWLPAPMLPGTLTAREAVGMFEVVGVLEEMLERNEFASRGHRLGDRDRKSIDATLAALSARIRQQKFISPDYQHVEGTSFAAPITASVAAQMLELDPTLTPEQIREGLSVTAHRIEGVPPEVQGQGLLNPRAAVHWVRERLEASKRGLG
jgi:serine protease AprX